MGSPTIVWFRQDLRIHDNAALAFAIERGESVLPVYVWAPDEEGNWAPGGASRWWLHHALRDLDDQLGQLGSRLVIRCASGKNGTEQVLHQLCRETGADHVLWNRRYEPVAIERDTMLKAALRSQGLHARNFNSSLLFETTQVRNKSGKPFQVFTPFWKHCTALEVASPVRIYTHGLRRPKKWPASDSIADLALLPSIGWDAGFYDFWGTPTRNDVMNRLEGFIRDGASSYPEARDIPATDGTTRLAPALHFGQIGPREAWQAFAGARNHSPAFDSGIMRQLVWREFAHHLLFHFQETPLKPLRSDFEVFPWDADERYLKAWQRGETGYPIVDAGMRQLWQTGWMHNRVRMIVGSLLVKHLLQHWLEGARWFWDTLVDADLANNTMGWQWIGGCGADAAPYFRIFNPITQGEKFDPDGSYVKKYVPELRNLSAKYVHRPWDLGELDLAAAGLRLGKNYPVPVIEHGAGRARALKAFDTLKAAKN
ncbi:MAG: deoxyribodipyrimidine photo-lyase [Verrucomicrobiae bacterium]|nr:deoxyribodipyrimidine photo-lyase [Verrucomicrobiae bacterium]